MQTHQFTKCGSESQGKPWLVKGWQLSFLGCSHAFREGTWRHLGNCPEGEGKNSAKEEEERWKVEAKKKRELEEGET